MVACQVGDLEAGRRPGGAEHLAGAADLEVLLGELEAVGRVRIASRALLGVGGGGVADEDADAFLVAATDARRVGGVGRAQAVGLFDDDERVALGTSTPTSMTVVATERVDEAGSEALHDVLVCRAELAVEGGDAFAGEVGLLRARRGWSTPRRESESSIAGRTM